MQCDRVRLGVAWRAGELPSVVHVGALYQQRADQVGASFLRDLDAPAWARLTQPIQGFAVQIPEDGCRVLTFAQVDHAGQLDLGTLTDVDLFVARTVYVSCGLWKKN